MSSGSSDELSLISRAVHSVAQHGPFPLTFGGLLSGASVQVSSVVGGRSHSLDGLVVRAPRGLGGRAAVEKKPQIALDYRTARGITHHYDTAVSHEGIVTLCAVPVVADGRTRGVLYAGTRTLTQVDDSVIHPIMRAAEELAIEFRVRDEVSRRLLADRADVPTALPGGAQETIRASFAQLRQIAGSVEDPDLRAQLSQVEHQLALLSQPLPDGPPPVRLSPRELDVLAQAGLGATNAEISAALGLRESTVKSYLTAAMSKLNASTRYAAVASARSAGLLP